VAGRRLPGAAEQKGEIFCLPGLVEDHGQICFSGGSLPCFFLRVLREIAFGSATREGIAFGSIWDVRVVNSLVDICKDGASRLEALMHIWIMDMYVCVVYFTFCYTL